MSSHPPAPRKGAKPRRVTSKRGGQIDPEGASARFTGTRRGTYPKEGFPKPEGTRARFTGDSQSNTLRSEVVPPIATRKPGDSKSTVNPLK